jgi:pyruvate dehydrogenase E2 component (dihydrolipoamide acetyltransferase)
MEEGVFVQWLKRDGEQVQPGDLLYTIEGDKASDDVEAFDSGILRLPPDAPAPGVTLRVGALLGYIVQPGEPAPFEVDDRRPTTDDRRLTNDQRPTTNDQRPREDHEASRQRTTDNGQRTTRQGPAISPRARRVARELGVAWAGIVGSGRTGRIVERDIRAAALRPPAAEVRASPLARRLAEELGVDIEQIAAGRPGRRIERADVEQAARAAQPTSAPAPLTALDQGTPMSGVRRITAARMAESAHTAAPVTLTTEADATELVRLRSQISADLAGANLQPPSYNDLLARLVALALLEHPALNATLADERIVQHAAIHIGIAVDTERGLLVPVVRDAHSKSVQQIAAESAHLLERVRAGAASPDDLRGGTFTITNLGMYDIDAFTPIVNLPECAILGVGRIVARPVVVDEQAETVAVRKMMALSLTFDHRVVDGAPAARFLKRVKQFVEHPYVWLTR